MCESAKYMRSRAFNGYMKVFQHQKNYYIWENVLQRPKHANKSCVMAKNETVCDNWKKVHTGNVK